MSYQDKTLLSCECGIEGCDRKIFVFNFTASRKINEGLFVVALNCPNITSLSGNIDTIGEDYALYSSIERRKVGQ